MQTTLPGPFGRWDGLRHLRWLAGWLVHAGLTLCIAWVLGLIELHTLICMRYSRHLMRCERVATFTLKTHLMRSIAVMFILIGGSGCAGSA